MGPVFYYYSRRLKKFSGKPKIIITEVYTLAVVNYFWWVLDGMIDFESQAQMILNSLRKHLISQILRRKTASVDLVK